MSIMSPSKRSSRNLALAKTRFERRFSTARSKLRSLCCDSEDDGTTFMRGKHSYNVLCDTLIRPDIG